MHGSEQTPRLGSNIIDSPSTNGASSNQHHDWLLVTLSCIGDAVITSDVEGRVTFLNPIAESLTGWPVSEALGRPLVDLIRLICEETRKAVEPPSIEALQQGRTAKLAAHSVLIAKDGTERPISDSAALIRNDQGEVAGLVMVFREISERRKTERALEKSLAFADDIIETLREPFVVLDSDLRVKTANRSFYEAFQVSKAATENRFVYDLGNGQWDIPGLRTLLDEVLSRREAVEDFEVDHTFPTLGRKTMLLNARPFPPKSMHPELILLAMQDISALRKHADELIEAGRQKDEFLATLAHELRNPLAPISNAVEYLRSDDLKISEVRTSTDLIARQVGIMVRLIEDLLDMSRITRNKLDVRKQSVELASVLESAVETSRPLIERLGHQLTISLPSEPIYLDADAVRLAQVFLNLLNNAAKYTLPGGGIWLTARQEGDEAVISVRDNGSGIPHDMLGRIFEMFTQLDSSLEQSHGGLGIGLTLVRRLVELHAGSIEVCSQGPGKGSEFVVRIPCIEAPHDPLRASPQTSDRVKAKASSGYRILVVEDNRDSASTLALLLQLMGHTTRIAYDGLQALQEAEAFAPNLVLLDLGLPQLNGYEVARRIRLQDWGRDMILVALTGWGQDEDRRRSEEAGFNFHLVKPVELALLEQLLGKSQVPQP